MLTLKINTTNAAFAGECLGLEAARILRTAADLLETGITLGRLYDVNGNRVGTFTLTRRKRGTRDA